MAVNALTGCLPLAIFHPTKHTTFYAGLGWTSMDGIDRLSHIIPYIQLVNVCSWTALDGGMAEGKGFEPLVPIGYNSFRDQPIYHYIIDIIE